MFDALINASLRNRLVVLVAAIVLLLAGGLTLRDMPVDVLPDLNRPTVTLLTEAGGLAPEEVESLVTQPIEIAMNGMPGVMRVRSVSGIGLSVVYLEFDWGSDIYRDRQLVTERLGLLREQLPEGVIPQLGPISSIMGEIMLVALPIAPGVAAADGRSPAMAVRDWADWTLRPRLLGVSGVAQVIPIGGELREFRVEPDPARMRQLGVTLDMLETALRGFAANGSGGFLEHQGQEWMVRTLGRTTLIEDLAKLSVGAPRGESLRLSQLADVRFAPAVKRGDAGYNGAPAVIVSIQKQPGADTLGLNREVERALQEMAAKRPVGVGAPQIVFRQADFIERSIDNVRDALRDGAILVAVVLFLFLANGRTTLISLTAIPLSLLAAVLVFRAMGLAINTMTLGGLAIAIGELVDDAVVDVENVLRRLKQKLASDVAPSVLGIVAEASKEVRSGVVYATFIVVLVFLPLFALPGIEGRLFAPLGVAYVVSILASMGVAVTLTPVLCYWLLPKLARRDPQPSRFSAWLMRQDARLLRWSFRHDRLLYALAGAAVLAALIASTLLPRAFLPPFNEGTLTVGVLLQPGTALSEANRVGALAEKLVGEVPEVQHVGRRTGRAELDEHAEGVHSGELEISLAASARSRAAVIADIRARLAVLPASISVGQPIAHRLDHLLSGVQAQIALKFYGAEPDTLRSLAEDLRGRLAGNPLLADLQIEATRRVPQLRIVLDADELARYGLSAGAVTRSVEQLVAGARVTQVIEPGRRTNLTLRLPDSARDTQALASLLIETPQGAVPLARLARIEESDGPNQVAREGGERRLVLSANAAGSLDAAVGAIKGELTRLKLPDGYRVSLEGQFQAQEDAARRIAGLGALSLLLICVVLYSRYRSLRLTALILGGVPLALVGAVFALWITQEPLSVPALVGFITLTGISTRNGILKISHYINLCAHEGESFGAEMVLRGSLERLTPVLMTAATAALALTPLLLSHGQPGREILHPVAIVIFGGLLSATLLDTLLTPPLFLRIARKPVERLLASGRQETF